MPASHVFPALPSDVPGGIRINLEDDCPPEKIATTLLHELGHSIGLRHRPHSIMDTKKLRGLTTIDLQSIEQLRVEVLARGAS